MIAAPGGDDELLAPEDGAGRARADELLQEIHLALASVPGLSTMDALRLGRLIEKYGQALAGEAAWSTARPILNSFIKAQKGAGAKKL